MSSSPININNNALPEDCLKHVLYFSENAPRYGLVCTHWYIAAKSCYQYIFEDYQKDGKIKSFTLAIQSITPGSPISDALYQKAVKQTYLSVMSRTQAPHIRPAMASLDPSRPLALGAVLKIVEDANCVQLFENLIDEQVPEYERPLLEGDLARRAATLREWTESHQASLDRIVAFPDLTIAHSAHWWHKLHHLGLTTLPPEIGKCTNLQTLQIYDGKLTTLPQEIFRLTRLRWLNLDGNQITAIPPEIGQLTSLTSLQCSDNPITHLPSQIGQLTNLQELFLIRNPLTTLPKEMAQLNSLLYLRLTNITITWPHRLSQVALIADLCALDRICEAFKEGKTEEALEMFKELPTDTKNAIYGELHRIILPGLKNDYWRCGEDAFLQINGQWTDNGYRMQAISKFMYR